MMREAALDIQMENMHQQEVKSEKAVGKGLCRSRARGCSALICKLKELTGDLLQ